MDMNLSKLQEIAKDREAWRAAVHGVERVGHNLMTEQKCREPTDQCRPVEQRELTILVTENNTDQFNPGSSPYRPVLVSDKQAVF